MAQHCNSLSNQIQNTLICWSLVQFFFEAEFVINIQLNPSKSYECTNVKQNQIISSLDPDD